VPTLDDDRSPIAAPPTDRRSRAVIVLRYVTHYRVPFLDGLRQELARRGIELVLIHGDPEPDGSADRRQHSVTVPWARRIQNRWLHVAGKRLLWQPALPHLRPGDLVIVDQASSRLLNYVLLVRHLAGRQRLALWGHGRNFQEHRASRVGEAIKRTMSRRVHWWFAYNKHAVSVLEEIGFPPERVTNVQNAIDTRSLTEALVSLPTDSVDAVRAELDLAGEHVGVYVGGMYAAKRLPFLIEASDRIREQIPDFEMIFIGHGPHAAIVGDAAAERDWLHHVGVKTGVDRVPYMAAAQLLLMPGLVGLAILDSFALEVPLVTTSDVAHSVEIAYLEHDANGLMVAADEVTPAMYAEAVVALLSDPARLARLKQRCREERQRYTIEEMVRRFADGVEAALER
jgi:glycosyltransferase involved in cell wall biosynthesis